LDFIWEQEKPETTLHELLEAKDAADWASELPANIAQPKRMSAGKSLPPTALLSWCSCRTHSLSGAARSLF